MLTLSNISQRIEQLEEEEYSSTNAQLETWRSMVQWQYWLASLPDRDNWRKAFNELPLNHPVKDLYNSLIWFTVHFASALPDVTWKSEKAELCFAAWIEQGIEEGYSESALCSEEAMNDAIQFCVTCLTNGSLDRIDELKRQEAEQWELKLKYRRQAHEGNILPDGIKWLEEYDAAFWAHFTAKKETRPEVVKPITTEAITPVLPEVLPEAHQPKSDNYIMAHWSGVDQGWLAHTVDGDMPIYRNRLYKFSAEIWGNIQGDNYLKVRWQKVSNE